MLLIISGFAGSGKSSLADSLGKKLGIKVVHASSLLREMSTKGIEALENASPEKIQDWWESEEAKEFMKKRQKDGSLDRALDEKLMEIADAGNVILDSWTMPYLYKENAKKIWLKASPEVRAKRVASRDNLNYDEVLAKIKARDLETKDLYERLYHFKMGENLEIFDLVVNTDNLNQEEVFAEVLLKIEE
tara:strand:+ start:11998 stop:12567 length:570 start_codon:yes stop_codon:yes gene_type:complete